MISETNSKSGMGMTGACVGEGGGMMDSQPASRGNHLSGMSTKVRNGEETKLEIDCKEKQQ